MTACNLVFGLKLKENFAADNYALFELVTHFFSRNDSVTIPQEELFQADFAEDTR